MSLNSKTPTFITITNLLILVLVGFIVYLTNNPVALLGLFFLQNMPVFQEMSQDEDEEFDEATAPEDDYRGTTAGFTGELKK